MAQQKVQQEAEHLASLHELGTLLEEYDNYPISGLLTCLTVILLLPSPWFVFFLIATFKTNGPWSISFGIIALVTGLWILGIIFMLRQTYQKRHSRRFLYTHGLVFVKCQDEQVITSEAIHWHEIATIWHEVRRRRRSRSVMYTFQRSNGEIFGEREGKGVGDLWHRASKRTLGQYIEQETLPYLRPEAMRAYEQGQPVRFGPLRLQASGIYYQNNFLPWEFFERLIEDDSEGRLLILPKTGQTFFGGKMVWACVPSTPNSRVASLHAVWSWATVPFEQIPNLALFVHLVESLTGSDL
jgi:hypothetical protein